MYAATPIRVPVTATIVPSVGAVAGGGLGSRASRTVCNAPARTREIDLVELMCTARQQQQREQQQSTSTALLLLKNDMIDTRDGVIEMLIRELPDACEPVRLSDQHAACVANLCAASRRRYAIDTEITRRTAARQLHEYMQSVVASVSQALCKIAALDVLRTHLSFYAQSDIVQIGAQDSAAARPPTTPMPVMSECAKEIVPVSTLTSVALSQGALDTLARAVAIISPDTETQELRQSATAESTVGESPLASSSSPGSTEAAEARIGGEEKGDGDGLEATGGFDSNSGFGLDPMGPDGGSMDFMSMPTAMPFEDDLEIGGPDPQFAVTAEASVQPLPQSDVVTTTATGPQRRRRRRPSRVDTPKHRRAAGSDNDGDGDRPARKRTHG